MQGLWSTHRRTKINLNAESESAVPANANDTEPKSIVDESDPTPQQTTVDQLPAQATTQSQKRDDVQTPTKPPSSIGKRKIRTGVGNGEDGHKRAKSSVSKEYARPTTRLSDLGGVQGCIDKILELVALPLSHPEIYLHTGVEPPRGVLLHGPPGCGKTLLANAIAGVSGTELIQRSRTFLIVSALRNSVCPSSKFLRPLSCLECRANRRDRSVRRLMRQRCVILSSID